MNEGNLGGGIKLRIKIPSYFISCKLISKFEDEKDDEPQSKFL